MKKYAVILCVACLVLAVSGCVDEDYEVIDRPAYLRVFNDLNYTLSPENKDEILPFLTMLIDPVLDGDSVPVSAAITGDFLDQRRYYAPPYPEYTGNTESRNYEYPGNEDVLVGPILNGFDLSSWAQIPSGKHRILFLSRPISEVPFFDLEASLRSRPIAETTVTLEAGEVYTLEVLQKDFETKENGIYFRRENFYKLPLSDSLVYVNFYNLSAEGFWSADNSLKPPDTDRTYGRWKSLLYGIRDEMNVYYSLYWGNKWDAAHEIPGYTDRYMTTLRRNTDDPSVSSYYSFPLFADSASDRITTDMWQRFLLVIPGLDPRSIQFNENAASTNEGNYAAITCYSDGVDPYHGRPSGERGGALLPNLVVNIHSGIYNPRSFATVNTIEVVNGSVYLTTIQRKYDPPIYE